MGSYDIKTYDNSWTGKKDVNLRKYTNVYVNSRTEDPIGDSIKLGFVSDIDDIVFAKDAYTFFHFPMKDIPSGESNSFTNIQNTTIINDGATYGSAPYKSDRIYKLRYNYEDTSPYGRAQKENLSNGTWLCSWLSGDVLDKNTEPKWVDRWFDPEKIDRESALIGEPDGKSVYDTVSSEMTLDYGAYYKYWRVGEGTLQAIDDSIDTGNCLKIHLNDWKNDIESKKIVYNLSGSNTFSETKIGFQYPVSAKSMSFNGRNQYAYVSFDENNRNATKDEYSIVFWVKCDDWHNCTSYSILDNFYCGGWKFGVTETANNSFLFVYGNDRNNSLQNGTSCLLNNKGNLVNSKYFWKFEDNPNIVDMLIDTDLFNYVLDVDTKNNISKIYKIDYNGNRLLTLEIKEKLNFIDLSNDENGFVLYAYSYNSESETIASCYEIKRSDFSFKKLNQNDYFCVHLAPIVNIKGEYFITDKSTFWMVDNGNDTNDGFMLDESKGLKYYKYEYSFGTISIAVTYDNIVYVLKKDVIEKWEPVHHSYQRTNVFKLKDNSSPSMIDIASRNIDDKIVDVILVVSSEKSRVFVYSLDGDYIDEYDTSKYFVRPDNIRRVSMYDYFRRNKKMTKCVYFSLQTFDHDTVIFSDDINKLTDKDWHQFAAIIKRTDDPNCYSVGFYIDCISVGEKEIVGKPNESTYYYYGSPIVIGGRAGKVYPLNQEINICDYSFNGSFDDIRIYNRGISNEDLYYMYVSKFSCDDLIWHFETDKKNLVERVQKFYKFKMPGSKSSHYVLNIKGYKKSTDYFDKDLKNILENMIRNSLKNLTPAYTSLYGIKWS